MVRIVHHLICSLIALLVAAVGLANPEHQDPTPLEVFGPGLWLALAWLARRLVRRQIPEASFTRWGATLALATSAFVNWELTRVAIRDTAWLAMIPVALFRLAMLVAFLRLRTRLAFWFPATRAARTKTIETLTVGRNWQTALWTTVHLLAWGLIFAALRA